MIFKVGVYGTLQTQSALSPWGGEQDGAKTPSPARGEDTNQINRTGMFLKREASEPRRKAREGDVLAPRPWGWMFQALRNGHLSLHGHPGGCDCPLLDTRLPAPGPLPRTSPGPQRAEAAFLPETTPGAPQVPEPPRGRGSEVCAYSTQVLGCHGRRNQTALQS